MKYKKIVSFICLTAIFSKNIPLNLLSYANEINKIEKMENIKEESDSTTEDKISDTKVDTDEIAIKTEENKDTHEENKDVHVEEKKVSIEDNTFNAYIDGENELAFSLGFDAKTGKFIVKDRSNKELSSKNPNNVIYKINVYDKENKEKIAIELTGKDKGISNKLDILNESKYEIGDFIQIIPINSKEGLKIIGDIHGDINKEKEDYSDGIDEPDYIQNVRFEITEEGLKTVYNEAPVIHGLSDIKDVKDKNIDILEGISITDDHDKEIDISTIQTKVKQVDELSVEITYTATDSWGRKSSGSRIISGINPNNSMSSTIDSEVSSSENNQKLDNKTYPNTIKVNGQGVNGIGDKRVEIKFDPKEKKIRVDILVDTNLHDIFEDEYFGIKITSNDGSVVKVNKSVKGTDPIDEIKKDLDGVSFEYGDLIQLRHAEYQTRLFITGTVIDYEESEDSSVNKVNVIYEITESGLKNSRIVPEIKGLKDTTVLKGTTKEDIVMKGITAIDRTGDITNRVTYSNNFNINTVGHYTVTYKVTNEDAYSATGKRKIHVKSQPIITPKSSAPLDLEMGSITDSEVDDYLKKLVDVTDEDQQNIRDSLNVSHKLKPNTVGQYDVTYSVTDNDGYKAELKLKINVIRTISVEVPAMIPFQVVTNLKKKENEESSDPFIAGVIKLKNNKTSDVQVSLKSFNKQANSGDLELVDPRTDRTNWNTLSSDETMRKMALGMYHKSGLNGTEGTIPSKDNPLWLTSGMTEQKLGTLPRAKKIGNPSEVKLTFTSRHGKNFKGGTSRGKFDLVFKFE